MKIKNDNKDYMIGIVYQVPSKNVYIFLDKINGLIEPIKKYEVILTGDFNIFLKTI